MAGKRAALRVAAKNAARNKKRTFFLVALIALPVMVATVAAGGARAARISPEERATSEFGTANVRMEEWGGGEEMLTWVVDSLAEIHPQAEVLAYREQFSTLAPGTWTQISDLDLTSPVAEGVLVLTEGRSAERPGELVLTEDLALELGVGVGDTITLPLRNDQETEYAVVGTASHPILWRTSRVVVSPEEMDLIAGPQTGFKLLAAARDESALVAELYARWEKERFQFYPQDVDWPAPQDLSFMSDDLYATLTVDEIAHIRAIVADQGSDAAQIYVANTLFSRPTPILPDFYLETRSLRLSWDTENIAETPSVVGTGVAAVLLAEVAFIAGAAFATGTRRRLREIGLLGSNGASTSHIRATVVGEGLVAGLIGGVMGAALGILLLLAGRPLLQRLVTRRVEDFPLALVDLLGPILVAVVACVLAAWLPAKTASRVPTLTALQGRMPASRPKGWVVPAGLAVASLGTLLFAVGLAGGNRGAGAVAVIGAVLMIGGAALLAGPLVAWISRFAERFPVTIRIVLRDAGRHRTRAAAAVAATMVILLIPVAALAAAEAGRAQDAIYGLDESRPYLLVEGRLSQFFELEPLQPGDLDGVRTSLPEAEVAPFTVLQLEVQYPTQWALSKSGEIAEFQGGYYIEENRMLAVANNELLAVLGEPRLGEVLARDGIVLIGVEERTTEVGINGDGVRVSEVPLGVPRYSFPRVLVTEERAAAFGQGQRWEMALLALDPTILSNPWQSSFQTVRDQNPSLAFAGGWSESSPTVILGLAFLATMVVVLIVVATITALSAAEADNDLQTVVAVGASNSIRRRYLGLQSTLHTLFGAVLAVPLGLLLVKTSITASSPHQALGSFGTWDSTTLHVPWLAILALLLGLPVIIGLITALSVRSSPLTPPRRAA